MFPDWKDADVWFCGPLGSAIRCADAMTARGFSPGRFHHELSDMR
jgi:hypothetical protein